MKKIHLSLASILIVSIVVISPSKLIAAENNGSTQDITLGVSTAALIGLDRINDTPVSLSIAGVAKAGDAPTDALADLDTRIRITSVVPVGEVRELQVGITSAGVTVPAGTKLTITPSIPLDFVGVAGAPSGPIILLTNDVASHSVISSIGSCYSGSTLGKGYVIQYNFGKIVETSSVAKFTGAVVLTYTLSLIAGN